jgi:hypothetical protein
MVVLLVAASLLTYHTLSHSLTHSLSLTHTHTHTHKAKEAWYGDMLEKSLHSGSLSQLGR